MRTRTPKSATPKKTPPGRKAAAAKTASPLEPETPKTTEAEAATEASQKENNDQTTSTPSPVTSSGPKTEPPSGGEASSVMTEAKSALPRKRVVKKVVRVVKKVAGKGKKTPLIKGGSNAEEEATIEESSKEGEGAVTKDVDFIEKEEQVTDTLKGTEIGDAGGSSQKAKIVIDLEQLPTDSHEEQVGVVQEVSMDGKNTKEVDEHSVESVGGSAVMDKRAMEVDVSLDERMCDKLEKDAGKAVHEVEELRTNLASMEDNSKGKSIREDAQLRRGDSGADANYEDFGERVEFEDHCEDDFIEEDPEEPPEEPEALEEEHRELVVAAEERKSRKEYEIFVGGLDRDATEDDVRKVFANIGEVVEVRLHKNLSTNQNKGYAFVKFANKEHVKRALSEMKNPVILGKRCGTAPSEDNNTLFLGNICNTWTKEAIRQKLKDYGVEGVENITLVPDVQHEGRSRGFAFIEFACHADAILAHKRLQKPDVIFGHPERTAKVAFAEPVREPDPEVMAQVKTVFLDGLPLNWDEDRVREHLKDHGEIVRITLARNMSTAKRKDFGFVDFPTHNAAVACIESINNTELSDGNSKTRLRARLSNPLPKSQVVRGGMCGGFPIGQTGSGPFSRYGRGFARGSHHFNWPNFQRGRGFYQRGRGQMHRIGPNDFEFGGQYSAIRGRQPMGRGARRGNFRAGYHRVGMGVPAAGRSRPNYDRTWYDGPEMLHRDHYSSRRQPFPLEDAFDGPFVGRPYDDPYFYEDAAHGVKRPLYMTDYDPDYPEPSRSRPRFDYVDPASSFRSSHFYDTHGAGSGPYSRDFYGSDYGANPPYYGSDRSFGGGYYY